MVEVSVVDKRIRLEPNYRNEIEVDPVDNPGGWKWRVA